MKENTIVRIGVGLFRRVQEIPVSISKLREDLASGPEQVRVLDAMIGKAVARRVFFKHGGRTLSRQRLRGISI